MATLDSLPDDQRAVLSLVLQRGRGYDEIARMLSIDRAAVRERALAAFDALGPQTGIPDERRALITDYLLGQLPPPAAAETRDRLAASPNERAWARVVASELSPVASRPLPEIPSGGAADESAEPSGPTHRPGAVAPVAGVGAASASAAGAEAERNAEQDEVRTALGQPPPPPPEGPRSSRTGGIILLVGGAVLAVAVIVVVVVLASSGGGPSHSASSVAANSGTTSTAASNSSTTSSTSTAATPVAAMKLVPPDTKSKAAGFAEVVKVGTDHGIEIVAQHITPNTTRPPNAYAVWLYNSSADAHLLGFVNPGVGSSGRLETAGKLPTNAAHFKHVIITLETKASPKTPGTIVLSGLLSGLS